MKYNHLILKRTFSSALYVTGDKANETFRVLTPYLDFDERICDKGELEENIKSRGLDTNITKVKKYWNFYKAIDDKKRILEATKDEISLQIRKLLEEPEKNARDLEKLKTHAKLVKDDLKNVKDYLYGVEAHAVENVLSLPNRLDSKTPREVQEVVHIFLEKKEQPSKHHLEIAKDLQLIKFVNGKLYLKNEAALLELALQNYCDNFLLQHKFVPFSNADFVRSVVVEGCGTDFRDKLEILTLEDKHGEKNHELSRLHLVGGASLYSFMAYYTKHFVLTTCLPLKHHALGRKYRPVVSKDSGFFDLEQETAIEIFIATMNNGISSEKLFEEVLSLLIGLYENLGYHFRLVYVAANKLKKHESLRVSVEMFSYHLQSYVEVANVSFYGDYLSKRLLFTYTEEKQRKFPCIISGTILSVHKLLGCILEEDQGKNDVLQGLLAQYVS